MNDTFDPSKRMSAEEYARENPDYDPAALEALLARCLAELRVAFLKESDCCPASAEAHRGRVFRLLRNWVTDVQNEAGTEGV